MLQPGVVTTETSHKAPFQVKSIKIDYLPKHFNKEIILHINKHNKYKQEGKQHLYKEYCQRNKKLLVVSVTISIQCDMKPKVTLNSYGNISRKL